MIFNPPESNNSNISVMYAEHNICNCKDAVEPRIWFNIEPIKNAICLQLHNEQVM